jgi:hypothetical protein
MNMGQRHVELETAFTSNDDGSAILHIAQMEPNPAILGESRLDQRDRWLTPALAPGPALFFIVVNGVPSSNSSFIMVGNGQIGQQPLNARSVLPISTISAQLVHQYGG